MMNGTEWAQFKKESYEDLGQSVPTAFRILHNMVKDMTGMMLCCVAP